MTTLKIVSADEEQKQSCLRVLESMIEDVKAGNVVAFVAVIDGPGNHWYTCHSHQYDLKRMMGTLDIAKESLMRVAFGENEVWP